MATNKPAHEYFAPVEAYRSEKNLKTLSQMRREQVFGRLFRAPDLKTTAPRARARSEL